MDTKINEIIIPKTNRYILNVCNADISMWVTDVSLDLKKKQLIIKIIETQDLSVSKWLSGWNNKYFINLITYDGCGRELYKINFNKLSLIKHVCKYNYHSSDSVIHKMKISFKQFEYFGKHDK